MTNYPTRNWALVSLGAGAGKSTFIAANAKRPLIAVDSDGRFDSVQALSPGDTVILKGRTVLNPLLLQDKLDELLLSGDYASIAIDSLTKIYSFHSRRASMRNRQGVGDKNKASEMIAKADAVGVITNLAMFGTDMYYAWHETRGVDHKGRQEVRDMVSEVELSRLQTSINAKFHFDQKNGRYSVTVQEARDFGGVPVNVGFTIHDHPGNYWRGAGKRLERLMYTRFDGKDSAVAWGQKELPDLDETAVAAFYDEVRNKTNPKTPSAMWVSWVDAVDSRNGQTAVDHKKQPKKPIEITSTPKQSATSPTPHPESSQVAQDNNTDNNTFDTMFPKRPASDDPVPEEGKIYYYADGQQVDTDMVVDYLKYKKKFNKTPPDKRSLEQAINYAEERTNGW